MRRQGHHERREDAIEVRNTGSSDGNISVHFHPTLHAFPVLSNRRLFPLLPYPGHTGRITAASAVLLIKRRDWCAARVRLGEELARALRKTAPVARVIKSIRTWGRLTPLRGVEHNPFSKGGPRWRL